MVLSGFQKLKEKYGENHSSFNVYRGYAVL